jgi:hypothetical protein
MMVRWLSFEYKDENHLWSWNLSYINDSFTGTHDMAIRSFN